jgi:hypothetical protein
VGDFVYLRVTPLKGMQRFHVKGKLAPLVHRTVQDLGP